MIVEIFVFIIGMNYEDLNGVVINLVGKEIVIVLSIVIGDLLII